MMILCGVSGLILGVSLIAVNELVIRDELASLDRALVVAAHNAAHQFERERGALPTGVVTLPEALAPTAGLIAIYDDAGALVRRSPSFRGPAPALAELGVDVGGPVPWEGHPVDLARAGEPLRGVVVPLRQSGLLLYAASTSMVSEDRRFLLHALPLLFILAMVVTATISRAVGRHLARDVERLAVAVDAIGRGDLDVRVSHRVRGSEETAALARGLDAMAAQLESLMASQRRFITDAAHELRSPLATLRGELQLALRRQRPAEDYRAALATAVEDVEDLSELADELLDLAKPGEQPPALERVRVAELVDAAKRLASGDAASSGVELRAFASPNALAAEVCGLRSTLVRSLRNVLDNAIRHAASGRQVDVRVRETAATIELAVEDRGPGIDPAEAASVFAPFFRGRHARASSRGGAGLGLALAARGVEEHGGTLTLDPSFSGGARFILTLPKAPAPQDPARDAD
ncbi:MAG: HAMP domain-containing sensor histidine kinase [Nannocystaceae bacterium]